MSKRDWGFRSLAFTILVLVGCSPVSSLDGKGFGGTEEVLAALQAARDRLVVALGKLQTSGLPADLCTAAYTGDAESVRAPLQSLSTNAAGLNAIKAQWFSSAEIGEWKAALNRAVLEVDETLSAPNEARFSGNQIFFRKSAFSTSAGVDYALIAAARQAQLLRGLDPAASDANFTTQAAAIDAAAACLSSYTRSAAP